MSNERYNQIIDEAYENYVKDQDGIIGSDWAYKLHTPSGHDLFRLYTKEEFTNKCKTNLKFYEKWGLKIEERELSQKERLHLLPEYNMDAVNQFRFSNLMDVISSEGIDDIVNESKVPTKLITLTYNNETVESYE